MAAINVFGKTHYISTISRKNRALWIVYHPRRFFTRARSTTAVFGRAISPAVLGPYSPSVEGTWKRSCPVSHHVRESEIPEISACGMHIRNTGKFCLWNPESHGLESGIQLGESGIPLTIGIQNPISTDRELESWIYGVESTIQDEDGVGFPYIGQPVTTLNNEGITRTISSKL